MTSSQRRVMLWAVPRSVSSAMCRVMMNSGLNTQIVFQRYCQSYYFGPERVSDRYADVHPDPKYSYENAKQALELPYPRKELVFAKEMPYQLGPGRLTADWIPDGYTHTFITRHPRSTIESIFKVLEKHISGWSSFDPIQCGYKEQVEMMRILQQQGHRAIVLDADDLLDNPEGMLRAYCQDLGLEFRDSMINWEPLSEKDLQEICSTMWKEDWFANMKTASKLTRRPRGSIAHGELYAKFDKKTRDLIEKTIEENMKYYEEMYDKRLVV